MTTGFGLPPGVYDGNVPFADNLVVPVPRFGVDRFAHSAEDFEIREVVLLDQFRALTHKRADCGWSGVELVHLVLFADGPEAACVGVGGHAFEHDSRRAVRKWPVDDVAVASDPADVCGAPEDVTVVVVEDVFLRHRCVDEVAAGCVDHALRLAG